MTSRTNLRLVSFDNGGVRGLSQLEIMSNIMHRLNWKMHPNNSEAILPCQHFDLMGGSGTGGLIAIMLAKLRMSAEEAAEEFSIIAKDVFIPVNITPLERTQNLRKSLKIMITKRALPVDMKLEEEISVDNCACFVVANPLANLATNFCLRSYSARGHRTDPITVIEAALATCATRSIFEPVTVGADFKRKEYAGVGLGASNPIREVISEASSLFGGTSTVETLLSVGTGHPGIIVLKSNGGDVELNRVMQDIMTDCNQKAKEVEDQIGRAGIYFRFSVEHGMQPNYGSEVMNPAWIVTQTGSYLDGQEVKLDELTQSVGAPATVVTVDQLKSGDVPTVPSRNSARMVAAQLEATAKIYDEILLEKLNPRDVERGSPIRECMEGTRGDILDTILNWTKDFNTPNIFWLAGHPGVGKSAIATSLVERLQASGNLGSIFFFQRDKASSITPNALWRSIAHDLARRYTAVKQHLIPSLERDEALLTTGNADKLFRELIQKPLILCEGMNPENVPVIVIDALDECGGLDGQHSSHRVNLMWGLKTWSTLSKKFKLLVTSRAEPDIVYFFSTTQHQSLNVLSGDSVDPKSSEDIEKFLEYHLGQIAARSHGALPPDWPGRRIIKWLTQIAAGLFIWVDTAIRFMKRGEPQEQLDRILGSASMGGLATLYSSILSASFVEPSQKVLEGFRRIVGTIILAKDPQPTSSLIHLCSVDHSTLSYIRNGLQSVLDSGDVLRFSHQSFVDFLLDPAQSHSAFSIDLGRQRRELTLACLKAMKAHLRFNICDIRSSHERNKDIMDLDERIKECIPYYVSYSTYYWAEHLTETGFDVEILEYVDTFMMKQFLFWLEVLSLTKRVNVASRTIGLLISWLRSGKQNDKIAVDMKKFVAAFGGAISQSMPHIYLSALSFSPQSSAVYREYAKHYPRRLGIERGGYEEWPIMQKVLLGHESTVSSVAFSPDGTRIVSGSWDLTVRVWDSETAEIVAGPLEGHTKSVTSVAFSPNGTRFVSGSGDKMVRVWDAKTAEMIAGPLEGHTEAINAVAFSPDGARIVSGSDDMTMRVWDTETAEMVAGPFAGHTGVVSSVAFSPDGKRVISGSHDKTIRVWDAETAEMIATPFEGHTDAVTSVTFSPNGTRVVSASDDMSIRVWDPETAKMVAEPLHGHISRGTSVAFSSDGTRVISASGDRAIWVWDAKTLKRVAGPFDGHTHDVTSVAFSPDGTRIVSGSYDNTIRVWDAVATDMIAGPSEGHADLISSVAFSPDGTCIVSGSYDQMVYVWDAETADIVAGPFDGHNDVITSVAFSPDGKHVASGGHDTTIQVWDVFTAEMVAGPFEGHTGSVSSVAFSPDGMYILSGSYDKTILVWDVETTAVVAGPFEGHTDGVRSVAFSFDGTYIVSGSHDMTIRVWDTGTQEMVAGPFEGHTAAVTSVVFSLDDTRIVSGSEDMTIRVWNAETAELVAGPFEGHTNSVSSVAVSHDGMYIVSGSADTTIRVWDANTAEMVAGPLGGHTWAVNTVAFSPDDNYVISGSSDNTIRVWDIETLGLNLPAFSDTSKLVDGWMLGPNSELLFWVPPALQTGLFRPSTISVLANVQ